MKARVAVVILQTVLWLYVSPAPAPSQATGVAAAIPPDEIVRAVETELFADDGVESGLIDVSIADGIISLSGVADNLLTRIRATQRAQSVKGVRAVINRIQVEPEPLPDLELEKAISTALQEDPAVDKYQIVVRAEHGTVLLTGTVDSWAEKELAGIVASSVKGVRNLKNVIEVKPPLKRDDDELRSEIAQRLRWDLYVDDGMIAIEVSGARVALTGIVGSATEKRRAISDAYVEGVLHVDANDLEVAFWARDERLRKDKYAFMAEKAIADAVQDALRHDPRVDVSNLSVVMQRRNAILSGVVSNLRALRAAAETAANVVGVWSVTNHLRVQPVPTPSDKTIRARVRAKIFYDPTISDQKINITADNGEVSLYGTVTTAIDKNRAEDLAASVNGVVDVANYLLVSSGRSRPEKSDLEIKEDIESELFWSPFVDSEEVEVAVDDGVATLTGVVDSRPEREAAEENAREGGAVAVDNELKVRDAVLQQ